jgi:hypothetical protein
MELLPSGLPKIVGNDEDLARFLCSRGEFNSTMVKPAAFLPNPKDGTKSVSRHGKEPFEGLKQLGREYLKDRTVYGAAIFKAHQVRAAKLEVVAIEPPLRHAQIERWPRVESDPELQKAKCLECALLISRHAELVRFEF